MAAIELRGVTKRFGDVTALNDLDLTVEDGTIYGFLGRNGAGKSTAINCILDFIRPTSGSVEVLGMDPQEDSEAIRQRTGVLPEGYDVYDRLTGRKHVEFAAESKGVDVDPDEVLARVGIPDAGDRKAGGYSKGMTQRLVLGMALIGEPDLLILDEPSSGLDPQGAREMREIIREERDRGATVFFSSHILEQVEAVCDEVGIIRDGTMVAEDSVEGLRDNVGAGTTLVVTLAGKADGAAGVVGDVAGVEGVSGQGDTLRVEMGEGSKTDVLGTLEDHDFEVQDFSTEEASLEELFVSYTTDGEEVEA